MTPEQKHKFIDRYHDFFEELKLVALNDYEKQQLLAHLLRVLDEISEDTMEEIGS